MSATTYLEIPLDHLEESPDNPRRTFNSEKLNELAESIVKQGVLQPIVVRVTKKPVLNGEHKYYEIVAGARRFRAAKIAELETIPAIVRELNDYAKEDPFTLETFAQIFKLNTDEIREKADFDSLSKKQQLERLSSKKKGAKK